MGRIQIRCTRCNRTMEVDRAPDDPPNAMEFLTRSPNCDDGDFHEILYLTATGKDALFELEHTRALRAALSQATKDDSHE